MGKIIKKKNKELAVPISTAQRVEIEEPIAAQLPEVTKFARGELMSGPIDSNTAFLNGWGQPEIALSIGYDNNYTPYCDYHPITLSEDVILSDILKHTAGKNGIQKHHPLIASVVLQSLEEHPELYTAYLKS